MAMIDDDLKTLIEVDERLYVLRRDSGAAWDMSKASMWTKGFAETLIENTEGPDYPALAADNTNFLNEVRSFHGADLDGNPDYALVFAIGERLDAIGSSRAMNPDGFLGAIKSIKKNFSFLCEDYGFALTLAYIDQAAYTRGPVVLRLGFPIGTSDCYIETASHPGLRCALEDLLFVNGKRDPLMPFSEVRLTSKVEVETWFHSVAGLLKMYGRAVLTDEPGAFERLHVAAEERNRLIGEECERLYGGAGQTLHDGGTGE